MLDDVRFLHNNEIFSSKMEIAIKNNLPSKKRRGQLLIICKEGPVGLTNCLLASTNVLAEVQWRNWWLILIMSLAV